MDTNAIDRQLATLREQISGRTDLLTSYNIVTNQLAALPKGKENYEAILALTEQQEQLKKALKENKKLQATYLEKIQEKVDLLTNMDSTIAGKIIKMEEEIHHHEEIRIPLSESVVVATELLNELGKLNRQSGKAKTWGFSGLLGGIFTKQKKIDDQKEGMNIIRNIRKLINQYKKELRNINLTEIPDLPVLGFLGTADQFLNNPITEILIQVEIRKLMKKTSAFEAELMKQLDLMEAKESDLESIVKKLNQQKIDWIENAEL